MKLFFVVTSFACSLVVTQASLNHRSEKQKKAPHVGIIGAGAAGLTSAFLLKEKGYRVTILERNDIGGFATTHDYKGKAYDMATMFVPGSSIMGPGIEPTLQHMIDFSGAELEPTMEFATVNMTSGFLDIVPEPLQKYTRTELISQLTRGLFMSWELFVCAVIDSSTCMECGEVCASTNTLMTDWAERFGVPAYAELILFMFDGVGGGPSSFGATFRSTLSHFAVTEAVHVLRSLGLKPADLDPSLAQHPKLFEMIETERWYFFGDGYQKFWEELAEEAEIKVKTKTFVTGISKAGDKWKISVENVSNGGIKKGSKKTSKTYTFDQVLVTTAPQDALPFLPDGKQKDLLATGVPRVPPNDVFLVEAEDIDSSDNDIDNGRVAFWPTGLGLSSRALVDPSTSLNGVKPFFFLKRHAKNNIYTIATYTLDPNLPVDAVFSSVKQYCATELGLKVKDKYLEHERYAFPSGPSSLVLDEWNQAWLPLQGNDGLWFNGEAFSRSGVPSITQYTAQFIAAAFPDI